MRRFYEFFAGGGMVRAGLGSAWECLFANDFDLKKARTYETNWDDDALTTVDVKTLDTDDLPGQADLCWASFPCQDLSLAGAGAGLRGERSGTFWPFCELMQDLRAENRAPPIITLENVCGTLTSHDGNDFAAICKEFGDEGYRVGAVIIDAALFVPQSRPRLFIVAVDEDLDLPASVTGEPSPRWHPDILKRAYKRLPEDAQDRWVWWSLPEPPVRETRFSELVEDNPASVKWHTADETQTLLDMMSDVNIAKVEDAKRMGRRVVGTVYKRTRRDKKGRKVQRAEIRFDGVAGCLRTPAGGSSRQLIVVVEGDSVRSRLMSARETARLMGLPDTYQLPENYNEAYHLTGDGVVVPAVRYLAAHLIEPVLDAIHTESVRAVA